MLKLVVVERLKMSLDVEVTEPWPWHYSFFFFPPLFQILSFFDLVRYCVSVCNQIACHLHIFVFKIKPCSVLSSSPHWGHVGHYWLCFFLFLPHSPSLPSVLHWETQGDVMYRKCFCQLNVRTYVLKNTRSIYCFFFFIIIFFCLFVYFSPVQSYICTSGPVTTSPSDILGVPQRNYFRKSTGATYCVQREIIVCVVIVHLQKKKEIYIYMYKRWIKFKPLYFFCNICITFAFKSL